MSAPAVEIKKGRKFDQVLEGARRVFMRDGFEGASVDEIAREAQVSKATLYSYFPDKRLLFSEVARLECNRQAEEAMEVIAKGATVEHVLHEAATRILRFFLSDFGQQVFRICVSESHRFPELGQRFYASGPGLVRERLSKVLRPYVEAGILRIDDMDLAANQFGELCKGDLFIRSLCGMCQEVSEADIERVVNGAVEMFLARYRA
ncbi:MAG: TetR/AcrR family transcriptional regulator [Roseovarius sp.]|uniref:TetR/AcrR family transcriptional regulator n=1 Tax=Roseovarius sp. TaxID=1486281 RepID=UPI00198DF564|nr:TetR/AcrR family transcriptional regulator [Roseovarius sp.]MBC7180994.1 TetR/AcrR family transcriptional regulator [Roseovarius sp.]MBQ0752596.1 TetR/AcrR family transcriptional regulator [Roseovarius sp.]MBQ0810301.1 TetR/AcrR family transcriptional regulator [Roseovarius sp.]